MDLLSALNERQREAVEYMGGPLLVLAGAGSGKTRVLTYKIAYLVSKYGMSTKNILALTFTNKAAREMRERTSLLTQTDENDMWVMTFHSFCTRLLRIEGTAIGIEKNFSIYSDSEKKPIFKAIIGRMGLNDSEYPIPMLMNRISDAKNRSTNPEAYLAEDYIQGKVLCDVYREYEKAMRTANALDFDDLLIMTVKLFKKNPDILKKYQDRFKYILVDEYQDTNATQYEIVHLLSKEHRKLCVVGDDDQSIYGWRGADISNILDFEKDFPDAKTIRLEQNYRSTSIILDAANAVISNNAGRKGKNLWTDEKGGKRIVVYHAESDRDEANYVCKRISEAIDAGGKYNQHAILYRTNAQSRSLETALINYGIPYKVYGGLRFYERLEVMDILAYLRLIINPDDDAALRRIINVPSRGIGGKTIATLDEKAEETGTSMLKAMRNPENLTSLGTIAKNRIKEFLEVIDEIDSMYREGNSADKIVERLIESINYYDHLKKQDGDITARMENIKELVGAINESGAENLADFLEIASLATDTDNMTDEDDRVAMMTVHSAKGLEFDTVYITGMEDGMFPTGRALENADQMEEERRLFYVGITRARKRLFLLRADRRFSYNIAVFNPISRFIGEIPSDLKIDDGDQRERIVGFNSDIKSKTKRGKNRMSELPYTPKPGSTGYSGYTGYYGSEGYNKALRLYDKIEEKKKPKKPEPPKPPEVRIIHNKNVDEMVEGVRVLHSKFGTGFIIGTSGTGSNKMIDVEFDDGSHKKLMAEIAPITIL